MDWRALLVAVAIGLATGGCRGSAIVVGNLTSMLIVVVMLWSTLHINES